jgi:hypothetical protein
MAGILEKRCLREIKALPKGVKAEKKNPTTNPKISLLSLSNFSNNTALCLSVSLSRHSGAARRHCSLSFLSLSGVILSLSLSSLTLSLSNAALSVSPPFFDCRHLLPLIIIVSISLLSFTHSHFLVQSITPHHWLCDCRFLLLTMDSCSLISLLLLIFMRVLWVLCWVCREV